jgi:hypothetical protein
VTISLSETVSKSISPVGMMNVVKDVEDIPSRIRCVMLLLLLIVLAVEVILVQVEAYLFLNGRRSGIGIGYACEVTTLSMLFTAVVVEIAPVWSFSFSTSSRTDKSATRDGLENIPDTVTGDILVLMLVLELLWLLKSVFTFTLAFDSRIICGTCGTCGTCHCVQRLVFTSPTLVPALIAMRCLWLRPKTQLSGPRC